jgi:hypothetical protein
MSYRVEIGGSDQKSTSTFGFDALVISHSAREKDSGSYAWTSKFNFCP